MFAIIRVRVRDDGKYKMVSWFNQKDDNFGCTYFRTLYADRGEACWQCMMARTLHCPFWPPGQVKVVEVSETDVCDMVILDSPPIKLPEPRLAYEQS